jgi:DNA-binding LacI/PurR family transcriptional regulator
MANGLKEISNITGYSLSTVSRVLSNKISGNSRSAKEILSVARKIGYSKYRDVQPSPNRILDIALITQHYSEEFYAYLYASFDHICTQENHSLTIHSLRYNKSIKGQLSYLSQNHDGFILFLPTLDTYGYNVIKKSLPKYPIVSIAPVFEPVFDTFTFDCYLGGSLAAEQFFKTGIEKLGIIRGPLQKWEAALRMNGFRDSIEKTGKKILWDFKGDYSFESGEKAFHSIHKKNVSKVGIFASNDQMAVGFIHAALENSVKIPGDYYVIGYDNILFSKIFYPKLTTINTDVDQLSAEAIEHLVRTIKGQVNKDRAAKKTLIPVNIILRDTHQSKK